MRMGLPGDLLGTLLTRPGKPLWDIVAVRLAMARLDCAICWCS